MVEIRSGRRKFEIGESDIIMWNEILYQLLTQKEHDDTYPVLKESEVREYINNGELKFVKHHISEFTKVPCTYYKLS